MGYVRIKYLIFSQQSISVDKGKCHYNVKFERLLLAFLITLSFSIFLRSFSLLLIV